MKWQNVGSTRVMNKGMEHQCIYCLYLISMYNVNVYEHVIFIYKCVYIYIHIHSSDHCAFIERVAMILMCLMVQATTSIAVTLDTVLSGKLTVCYGKKTTVHSYFIYKPQNFHGCLSLLWIQSYPLVIRRDYGQSPC